jgi:hypothetical protein
MNSTSFEGDINPEDVMMLILGTQEEIIGVTRFMKYLFLVDQTQIFKEQNLVISWAAHNYGPYWNKFNSFLTSLSSKKLLTKTEQTTINDYKTTKISITIKGKEYFRKLTNNYTNKTNELHALLLNHNRSSLMKLMKFVYENYPEFTINSKIKEKVLAQ